MLPIQTFLTRWIVLAVLGLAAFAAGYIHGLRADADRHAEQMAGIAAAGATQTATARAETAQRVTVSKGIANDYQAAQARLAARALPPAADRLRGSADHPGGGGVPADSSPAGGADAVPEKLSSGPNRGPSGESEEFVRSCAADAQQVMWLQDWIERVVLSGGDSLVVNSAPELHQNSP